MDPLLKGRRSVLRGGLAGGATLLAGCFRPIPMDPQGWGNVLGSTYALPRWQWAPGQACDVVSAVRRAESEKRRIRMTGSGYSFSDVAVNDDWLLSPRHLTERLPLTSGLRPDAAPDTLVRVQSGITVNALNAALDDRGLALPNMGAFDKQTYVGAASTGTHGSGWGWGPLAAQIVSIQVVARDGDMIQVEPTCGITDRAKFDARLPEQTAVKVDLQQDDGLFNALAVSLGCLGVIYAVTLRVVPKFWLIERRTMTTWEELARPDGFVDRLLGGGPLWPVLPDRSPLSVPGCIPLPGADPDHVEINYTPYPDAAGEHTALLTLRWRTRCKPPSVGGVRGSVFSNLSERLLLGIDHREGNLALAVATTSSARASHVDGMRSLAQSYYADRSDVVFQIGILDDLHVYGIELHFDACQTKAIVQRNFVEAMRLADYRMHHSSPPTLRFIPAASPLLSMNSRRRSVSLEFGIFTDAYGAEELLRTYEDIFVGQDYGGRPHWGLDRNYVKGERAVRALYPETWPDFRRALGYFNPHGTFDGRVTDRLGVSFPDPGRIGP